MRHIPQSTHVNRGMGPHLGHDRFQNSSQLANCSTIGCYTVCYSDSIGKQTKEISKRISTVAKKLNLNFLPQNSYTKKLHEENKACCFS